MGRGSENTTVCCSSQKDPVWEEMKKTSVLVKNQMTFCCYFLTPCWLCNHMGSGVFLCVSSRWQQRLRERPSSLKPPAHCSSNESWWAVITDAAWRYSCHDADFWRDHFSVEKRFTNEQDQHFRTKWTCSLITPTSSLYIKHQASLSVTHMQVKSGSDSSSTFPNKDEPVCLVKMRSF